MGKNLKKRNLLTIYVREEYQDTLEKFQKAIEHDEKLQQLRYKVKDGLMSVVIMQLILKYVTEQEAENEKSTKA